MAEAANADEMATPVDTLATGRRGAKVLGQRTASKSMPRRVETDYVKPLM
jgi:hypothetical protein